MKVSFLYREARAGGFSIEEVFGNVRCSLPPFVEQQEWYVDGTQSRWSNLLKVHNLNSDLYHITGDCNYLALNLPSSRTILTVHDVGHYELTLQGFKKYIYGKLWWDFPLRKAGCITAISSFTKDRLQKNFDIKAAKIHVIYNPLPQGFSYSPAEFNTAEPRILQIGGGRNKNVERLIEAVAGISCKLVLVQKVSEQLKHRMKELNIRYEEHRGVSRDELIRLYQSCDLLYFASTYEGFGLPIIEAQLTGRPVITSTVASMPEIAGGSAILVNPMEVQDIRKGILSVTGSPQLAKELVEKGQKNIERFNAATIAQHYADLYRTIYHQNYTISVF
jgi:glycosyltransferase involved in cell wall biosynthesis